MHPALLELRPLRRALAASARVTRSCEGGVTSDAECRTLKTRYYRIGNLDDTYKVNINFRINFQRERLSLNHNSFTCVVCLRECCSQDEAEKATQSETRTKLNEPNLSNSLVRAVNYFKTRVSNSRQVTSSTASYSYSRESLLAGP